MDPSNRTEINVTIHNRHAKEKKAPPTSALDEMIGQGVEVPDIDDNVRFSFRQLFAFIGPGFLMSIAYLDPGNIDADVGAGAKAGFNLIWVLLGAHVVGLMLQRLSARLGVVAGKHLAEVATVYYLAFPRILLWIMIEIAIICADMQEVIGTAIAFTLLSDGRIPLWAGVLITIIDTLTFLFIDRFGTRKLEVFFCSLIGIMAITFGTEYVLSKPNQGPLLYGMFIPTCGTCSPRIFLQAVSIIGAVIQPHNLYLHSALVKSRRVDRSRRSAVSRANFYFFIESAIALLCAFIINLFVLGIFAVGMDNKQNVEIRELCIEAGDKLHYNVFPNNTELIDTDTFKGGIYLGCKFGVIAFYIWAIGLFAAGQSSTMAGCYAGQFVMEGFLHIRWARWKRVLFTRSIAIVPTLMVALFQDLDHLTGLNDVLNASQMIQLPFALIPMLTFTASETVMKDFRTNLFGRIFFGFIGLCVIAINLYFVFQYIYQIANGKWYIYFMTAVVMVLYFIYVFYLIGFWAMDVRLRKYVSNWLIKKIFYSTDHIDIDSPWVRLQNDNSSASCNAEDDRDWHPSLIQTDKINSGQLIDSLSTH